MDNSKFKARYLSNEIQTLALDRSKMAFISGPRQVGKTTFAKSYSPAFDQSLYKNWDESEFRRTWSKTPNQLAQNFSLEKHDQHRLLILDEIHKSKNWKQKLKGLFDELGEQLNIIVTGSARLNVFKKGGDSLLGRYLNFRLHPFSYGEVTDGSRLPPEDWRKEIFQKPSRSLNQEPLDLLLKYTGFPEPFFSRSDKILNIWRRSRNEKIVREDLRDLSRLPELSQVEMLTSLLPEKVGSPLSVQSLREDLDVSHDTVTRWLTYLKELYYFFEIKPWSKSVKRSLKKEGKIYLYDWTEIPEVGIQFENLVAAHLLKACHFWSDTGEGDFELFYLRNKDKQEIDFLIVKNKKPWVCFEAKLEDPKISLPVVEKFTTQIKCPFVQIVKTPGVWQLKDGHLVSSATHIFKNLP